MNSPTNVPKDKARSHEAVLSWSLGGVVNALRLTISNGLSPGQETISLLDKLREQIEAKGEKGLGLTGVAIDNVPRITEQSNPVDVLVVAEVLHGIILCLLEPDERQAQERMGFRT